jgi:putative effector of murein hydrolase LrgA (UPF0299 family)
MTSQDWVAIIGAIAAGLALVLGAIGALWRQIHQEHTQLNRRMSEIAAANGLDRRGEAR